MSGTWMIYGATGYTGRLIAAQGKREGLTPIIAGRRAAEVNAVAGKLGLESRIFSLEEPAALRHALQGVAVLAHCAGPFSATSAPVRVACREARCHYVDITGEIAVFEAAHAEDGLARAAGIVVCPGVGFDVIPTDCLAACLQAELPDATSLSLGFDTDSALSKGTATTAVEGLALGGMVRRGGVARRVPLGHGRRTIDFGCGAKTAVAVPWGDVATAFFSTGIPNIAVFTPMPAAAAVGLRALDPLRPILGSRGLQAWLKGQVARRMTGPDGAARDRHPAWLWGEARSPAGATRVARLRTGNVYDVTVHGVLMAVRHLLGYAGPGGYFTPSRLMGARCVERLPGVGAILVEESVQRAG